MTSRSPAFEASAVPARSTKWFLFIVFYEQRLKAKGEFCEPCKLLINTLDGLLEDNATRDDIEKALEKVCDQAPSELQQTVSCYSITKTRNNF